MPKNMTIIGGGRLAVSLGRLWSTGGILSVQDVLSRSLSDSSRAVSLIGSGRAVTEFKDLRRADLILISTPDGAISSAAGQLIAAGCVDESCVLFHCSGAESSELLAPARGVGAAIASAHPLMTFSTEPIPREQFAGSYCAIEGDPRARILLEEVFTRIGAKTIEISTDQKILYHAAAIFSSNYVMALLQAAIDIHGLLGIRPELSREMIAPLVRRSVDNAIAAGPQEAMTGPIVRGDTELVRRQLAALLVLDPDIGGLYKALAAFTARVANVSNPVA